MHRIATACLFTTCLFTTLLFTALATPVVAQADGAVLSQVTPGVTLQSPALGATRYPARPLQLMAPGSTLELPLRGRAVVICADDRVVELNGPQSWQLGSEGCRNGRPVAQGTYRRLRPSQGRAVVLHGSLLTEAPSRSDDENGKLPVLLRPRSPQRLAVDVGEASPELVWTAVNRAQGYELVLDRGSGEKVVGVDRPECRPNEITEPLRSCTAPWPWPPMRPGETVKLLIRAHVPADADWPVRESDVSKLRRVDEARKRAVEKRLAEVDAGDPPKATRALLRAAVLAEAELFNEAAEALAVALEKSPHAETAVRLGDLHLGLGQLRAALNAYGRAEALLPPGDDELRAALHLGRGRLYLRKSEPYLASQELGKAARYFRRAGKDAEAEIAETEAERASRDL